MSSEQVERRLTDIVDNIERIRAHTAGMSGEQFRLDAKTTDAVERCFERIAEAARKIGSGLDSKYPAVDLPNLRRFGSVLRHQYDSIYSGFVWRYVQSHLDPLEAACRAELAARKGADED